MQGLHSAAHWRTPGQNARQGHDLLRPVPEHHQVRNWVNRGRLIGFRDDQPQRFVWESLEIPWGSRLAGRHLQPLLPLNPVVTDNRDVDVGSDLVGRKDHLRGIGITEEHVLVPGGTFGLIAPVQVGCEIPVEKHRRFAADKAVIPGEGKPLHHRARLRLSHHVPVFKSHPQRRGLPGLLDVERAHVEHQLALDRRCRRPGLRSMNMHGSLLIKPGEPRVTVGIDHLHVGHHRCVGIDVGVYVAVVWFMRVLESDRMAEFVVGNRLPARLI